MLVLSQAASSGALSSKCCTCSIPSTTSSPSPSFSLSSSPSLKFSCQFPPTTRFSNFKPTSSRFTLFSSKATDNGSVDFPATLTKQSSPPPFPRDDTVLVGHDGVPLEGVIQFDKPTSNSRIQKWGQIALLAGGDVLALLLFAAIGRFSHGFPVLDVETLRTADPFVAGWFLSAYFLGGYAEDGRGMNGSSKAIFTTAKSWALGVPMGLGIRALTSGHLPPANFILVSLGSTAVLLIGCRMLLFQMLPSHRNKKDDTYRRGSPFELFELLTSLVRRW